MAGGTTHHCPLDNRGKGNCNRADIPNTKGTYCKTHQVYCQNPKPCGAAVGFLAVTDECKKCGWKHPNSQHWERLEKEKNAQANKLKHEERIREERKKKAEAAQALKDKKSKEAAAKKNKK